MFSQQFRALKLSNLVTGSTSNVCASPFLFSLVRIQILWDQISINNKVPVSGFFDSQNYRVVVQKMEEVTINLSLTQKYVSYDIFLVYFLLSRITIRMVQREFCCVIIVLITMFVQHPLSCSHLLEYRSFGIRFHKIYICRFTVF